MSEKENVVFCGTVIGSCLDWDGFDFTDQWFDFEPHEQPHLPSCAVLEIESKKGRWTAYDDDNQVIAAGPVKVSFQP